MPLAWHHFMPAISVGTAQWDCKAVQQPLPIDRRLSRRAAGGVEVVFGLVVQPERVDLIVDKLVDQQFLGGRPPRGRHERRDVGKLEVLKHPAQELRPPEPAGTNAVIPAKAGIHGSRFGWTPAFAGVTLSG